MTTVADWEALLNRAWMDNDQLFFTLQGLADWAEEQGKDTSLLRRAIALRKIPYFFPSQKLPYTWSVHPDTFGCVNSLGPDSKQKLARGVPWAGGPACIDYATFAEAYLDIAGLYHEGED